jgi:diguanylate cyclase (GGDEF)-like protein/PAS domain S-box-containing protein
VHYRNSGFNWRPDIRWLFFVACALLLSVSWLAAYFQHRHWYWAATFCFNLIVIGSSVFLVRKINRLIQTQMKLAISEDRYRTIIGSINDGVYVHDIANGAILDVNEKGCEFYGLSREELLSGNLHVLSMGEYPYSETEAKQWFLLSSGGEPQVFEWQIRHQQGYATWVEVSMKRMLIGKEPRIIAVARDISERKIQEAQIQQIAYKDALTGLPNRAYLKEILRDELEKANRNEAVGAILFVDLDGLKMVNDHFGHSCGDDVIKMAGKNIMAMAGEGTIVSRLGGDEFIIMIPNQHDRKKVAKIAENMINLLSKEYVIAESNVYMSASIGVALYPLDAGTVEEVLKKADLAMYTAKGAGGNTWRFYDDFMEKENRERLLLKHGLRGAIARGELSLQYQPIVMTANKGDVISFEALLRWNSPEYGAVPPSRFIPLAEENETILVIGQWVLEEAARFVRKLSETGRSDVRVWVNVSPRQLVDGEFSSIVRDITNQAGINPNQLGIEITEHALIASLAESTLTLDKLRQTGVHLAIDDFGTGYSSLTYLKKLPVQTIKIDKSFIEEIVSDEGQLRFVRCIFTLAHVLGLSVVAEGVETQEQLEKLARCQCDFIQGYLISRPISESEALCFLTKRRETKT